EGTCAWNATEQAEDVACNGVQTHSVGQLSLDIGNKGVARVSSACERCVLAEQKPIDRQQTPRLLIGGAAHHHAIDMLELFERLLECGDAAIEDDRQAGVCNF